MLESRVAGKSVMVGAPQIIWVPWFEIYTLIEKFSYAVPDSGHHVFRKDRAGLWQVYKNLAIVSAFDKADVFEADLKTGVNRYLAKVSVEPGHWGLRMRAAMLPKNAAILI